MNWLHLYKLLFLGLHMNAYQTAHSAWISNGSFISSDDNEQRITYKWETGVRSWGLIVDNALLACWDDLSDLWYDSPTSSSSALLVEECCKGLARLSSGTCSLSCLRCRYWSSVYISYRWPPNESQGATSRYGPSCSQCWTTLMIPACGIRRVNHLGSPIALII